MCGSFLPVGRLRRLRGGQEAKEDVLPGVPGQQPEDHASPAHEDLAGYIDERPEEGAEVHAQQAPLLLRVSRPLDLAWRYTDAGVIETGAGPGRVEWLDGSRDPVGLDLAPTQAPLRSHGLHLSLRYEL